MIHCYFIDENTAVGRKYIYNYRIRIYGKEIHTEKSVISSSDLDP
jgi:hypothetical protein